MMKFFSRFRTHSPDPAVSTWGNLAQFYSLLIFLIAIPFILIVSLVWLTGILGFSAWILTAFACLCAWAIWRLYRRWGQFKTQLAAQGSEFQDLVREATRNGKNVEVSLLNGVLTLRYHGQAGLAATLPQGRSQPLALAAPLTMAAETASLPPERLREELEEFIRLRDSGEISPEEFDRIKTSLLQRVSA